MLEIIEEGPKEFITIRASGTLEKSDYDRVLPRIRELLEAHGTIRLLLLAEDLEGWTPRAIWEDLKWDLKYIGRVERYALVGDKKWQKWMNDVFKFLVPSESRFFTPDELTEAKVWLEAG